ncbi:MAG TPA: molybdenum cofactor guanylyltransferase [Pyrinomonadaceae bacterium]|nr:molybdenum cofactor guanylyltransferase [Pyrinomonadaceae bacterium]
MDSVQGFVLTGGRSRRMGTDKSRLSIDGQTFLQRIAAEMTACGLSVTVVGGNSADTAFRHVPDVFPNWGALGGVHAALASCTSDWALVIACDFPFVTRQLIHRLSESKETFEAVAPIQSDLIPQPLCSLYRVVPCLSRTEVLINSGERKPIALLQSVRTRWVLFDEIADLEGAERFFDNINSPDDYSRILSKGDDGG